MNSEREREREKQQKRKAPKTPKRYCCTSYKFDTKRQQHHQQTVYNHQLTDGRGDVGFGVSGSGVLLHDLHVECRLLFPVVVLRRAGGSTR